MLLLLQSILNNYSDDEILQMCKTINKDYVRCMICSLKMM